MSVSWFLCPFQHPFGVFPLILRQQKSANGIFQTGCKRIADRDQLSDLTAQQATTYVWKGKEVSSLGVNLAMVLLGSSQPWGPPLSLPRCARCELLSTFSLSLSYEGPFLCHLSPRFPFHTSPVTLSTACLYKPTFGGLRKAVVIYICFPCW